ncbi:Glucose-6-phosphate dehydrogenase subunit [Corynebacterium ciconiae DSM 44920]|uniref:glucose-6-phosphate dehydrogenase assembly protein OpcA n=1 Tax=Corynebacterium ciconiae TaxID=227319 RepID=UPI00035FDFE8|nr:glucose-6-phosphate dehydrogenase assembly protein OpcA [Corynebacterium ciconiae]WKD61247.1 Glucose-6-phosphate dehydrogenase subunit [Corynebacterium ciconiae DSM 44920]
MIFSLPSTTSRDISKALVSIRDTGSQVMTGRVLTLIIVASTEDNTTELIELATDATREHPARVLMVLPDESEEDGNLDAEIRIGGDAGASEIVVMRVRGELASHVDSLVTPLLLPDTPIVAWWPSQAPEIPAEDPIGQIAQRRITDSFFDPRDDAIFARRSSYAPGDSDLAWSRLTTWRGVVASALDRPPYHEIVGVEITGPQESPSVELAGGWLADRLGLKAMRHSEAFARLASPVFKLVLHRKDADPVVIEAVDRRTMRVSVPGSADALVAASRRSIADCLAEELRHLDPDRAYGQALRGLSRVHPAESSADNAGATAESTSGTD